MISDALLYTFLVVGIFVGIFINAKKKTGKQFAKILNISVMASVLGLIFFMAMSAGDYISKYLTNGESLSLIYSIILYSFVPGLLGILIASIILGVRHGK